MNTHRGGDAALTVDPDTGPTVILGGRIVTMGDQGVIDHGRLAIRAGTIVAVLEPGQHPPQVFEDVPVIETGATLYPGLIDLHNHRGYNINTLWAVPQRYDNRGQWRTNSSYAATVQKPTGALAHSKSAAPKAIVRYVEAKALVGGTCTGQGMKINSAVGGWSDWFTGAMRNVERTDDPRLPEAEGYLLDLEATNASKVDTFRRQLAHYKAYFYHLSEGTDLRTRERFSDLQTLGLITKSLVGIHSLALNDADYGTLATAESKIVWSPFSNLLLYGATLRLEPVLESRVPVSLGCDWSPTGSKNLLEELKVAHGVIAQQQVPISDEDLIRMVTTTPAATLGWDQWLGALKTDALADVVAIAGTTGDPYTHLIKARERDVALVLVHGTARYGDPALMSAALPTDTRVERFEVAGLEKAFYLHATDSPINGLSVADAEQILQIATAHLHDFEDRLPQDAGLATDAESFTLELDTDVETDESAGLAAVEMAESIELDAMFVDEARIAATQRQTNLPAALMRHLQEFYA